MANAGEEEGAGSLGAPSSSSDASPGTTAGTKARKAPKAAKPGKSAKAAKAAKADKSDKSAKGGKPGKPGKAARKADKAARKADKAARKSAKVNGAVAASGKAARAGNAARKAAGVEPKEATTELRADEPTTDAEPKPTAAEPEPTDAAEPEPAAPAEPQVGPDEPADDEAGEPAREPEPLSEEARGLAEGRLAEALALLRQAQEPAAQHIVERVAARDRDAAGPGQAPVAPLLEIPVPEPGTASGSTPGAGRRQAIPTEHAPVALPPGAVIGAAIDVGATSLHLLVAAAGGHRVQPILDESVFLGLGDRVSSDGRLGRAAREELIASLVAYTASARQLGAEHVTVVGTEPLRRADDAALVIHEVESRVGVPVHVLDHEEEGRLTLLGVTKGLPITAPMLVLDVGGGSTEFVTVAPDGSVATTGLPLGAARLTRDLVRGDPPSLAEIEALKAAVKGILEFAPDIHPGELVAVGGTSSNLLRLLPATALDRVLTRRRLTVALAMLTVERSLEAAERHLVRPARARILPAGAIIVDAILEHYGVDRLRVSEDGIREGLVLAVAAAGPAWRDRLPMLIRGWAEEAWPLD